MIQPSLQNCAHPAWVISGHFSPSRPNGSFGAASGHCWERVPRGWEQMAVFPKSALDFFGPFSKSLSARLARSTTFCRERQLCC